MSLDCIFEHSLQSSPESRDLNIVLALLESSLDAPRNPIAQQKGNVEPKKDQSTHAENTVGGPLKESYPPPVTEGTQKVSVRVFCCFVASYLVVLKIVRSTS